MQGGVNPLLPLGTCNHTTGLSQKIPASCGMGIARKQRWWLVLVLITQRLEAWARGLRGVDQHGPIGAMSAHTGFVLKVGDFPCEDLSSDMLTPGPWKQQLCARVNLSGRKEAKPRHRLAAGSQGFRVRLILNLQCFGWKAPCWRQRLKPAPVPTPVHAARVLLPRRPGNANPRPACWRWQRMKKALRVLNKAPLIPRRRGFPAVSTSAPSANKCPTSEPGDVSLCV